MRENKTSPSTAWVDQDDAPELTDAFFEHADEFQGASVIQHGRPKTQIVDAVQQLSSVLKG